MQHTPRARRVARWALPLALCLSAACGGQRAAESDTIPAFSQADGRVVSLSLQTLDGQRISLARYRGRSVLVLYFATWCVPCTELFPVLDDMVNGPNPVRDLAVLGVSVDLNARDLLPHFLEYIRTGFPVVLADLATLDGKSPFGPLPAIPAAFLVDPKGRHVETYLGVVPVERLRRRVEQLQAQGGE